jgi:C-terminal processing protease CtpA/Prc
MAAMASFAIGVLPACSQPLSDLDRGRGHIMLKAIKDEVKKTYYDPTFHGLDLEAHFTTADHKIDLATSNSQVFGIIAQFLIEFDDSHLFFMPPRRAARVEYGWRYQAIGDNCFVVAVKPGSDAEKQGLRPGDLVVQIDGFQPTRANVRTLQYLYNSLRPRPGMRLVVKKPDGAQRPIEFAAQVSQEKRRIDLTSDLDFWAFIRDAQNEERLHRHQYQELEDVFIWKMPQFDLDDREIRRLMGKVMKSRALILDLRGNPGGYVDTMTDLLGYFFDHDVKIADVKSRRETKPLTAKTRGDRSYKGEVVLLIDSESGSSAELLARIFQLQKRGTVIGDQSAGAVMRAQQNSMRTGADLIVIYGVSVTDADVIMTDGASLEHKGVIPDELLLPSAADLAGGRDPVLARAAKLVRIDLDPERAGSMFPVEWRK